MPSCGPDKNRGKGVGLMQSGFGIGFFLGPSLTGYLSARYSITTPIYLAAVGPRNLELAGEVADGWHAIFFSPEHSRALVDSVVAGRRRGGHGTEEDPLAGFDIAPSVPVVISDDVEDTNSVKTREGRNKTYEWFTSEILPIGSQKTKFVTIGNLLHEDSLLMRVTS